MRSFPHTTGRLERFKIKSTAGEDMKADAEYLRWAAWQAEVIPWEIKGMIRQYLDYMGIKK